MARDSLVPKNRAHCCAKYVLATKNSGLMLKLVKCDALLVGLNPTDS